MSVTSGGANLNAGENTITGGLFVSGDGTSTLDYATNTITGGLSVTGGGRVTFQNEDQQNKATTIDTVTLNAQPNYVINNYTGAIYLGGAASQTTIGTFNWHQGALKFSGGNSFGTTHIGTLNLVDGGDKVIHVVYSGQNQNTVPLFTIGTLTGDPSSITVQNSSPFTEVVRTSNSGSNGVSIESGKVIINLVPTATTPQVSNEVETSGAMDVLTTMQSMTTEMSSQFAPTSYDIQAARRRMVKAIRENPKDPYEAMVTALSQEDGAKIFKFKGDYRVWAAPYSTYVKNTGAGGYKDGYTEKYYGLVMGVSHFFKSLNANITTMMGFGASKTQMERSANSHTNGKSMMMGVAVRKPFFDKLFELESNLSTMLIKKQQLRQGNPSPSQSYIAVSDYNTYALAWRNEFGHVFRLQDGYSLRPALGLQINGQKRTKIEERNAGVFGQRYRPQITKDGEAYGGLGLRKVWRSEDLEGKVTFKYEMGRKSGNGKSRTTIYSDTVPNGITSSSSRGSNVTHYLSMYGSLLHTKNHWKVVPGVMTSLTKGQKSITGSIKFEYRW
jgi:hypothetical protein